MSVSHSARYEPTRSDVWTVLEELPHRIQELLERHESSRELGFEALEQELHALFTHAECAATREALERRDVDLRMYSSMGRSIAGCTGARRPICARWVL